MVRGWLKMWWHCLWRLHRMETCKIGVKRPWRPIGFDCECGAHFWHDEEFTPWYTQLRALAIRQRQRSTGDTER